MMQLNYSPYDVILIILSGIMIGVLMVFVSKMFRQLSVFVATHSTKIGFGLFGLAFLVAFLIISGVEWNFIFQIILVIFFLLSIGFLFYKSRTR